MSVVVGFINNPEGRQALDLAIEEAERRQTRLIVVHSMRGGSRTKEEEYINYRQALEELDKELTERGLEHEIHEPRPQDLMEAVDEFDAEVLVIGYKRRTATGKALLGSHAQEVLMNAEVPVLAVMAPN